MQMRVKLCFDIITMTWLFSHRSWNETSDVLFIWRCQCWRKLIHQPSILRVQNWIIWFKRKLRVMVNYIRIGACDNSTCGYKRLLGCRWKNKRRVSNIFYWFPIWWLEEQGDLNASGELLQITSRVQKPSCHLEQNKGFNRVFSSIWNDLRATLKYDAVQLWKWIYWPIESCTVDFRKPYCHHQPKHSDRPLPLSFNRFCVEQCTIAKYAFQQNLIEV